MSRPYKKIYAIECELCGKVTPVKLPSLFDAFEYSDVPKYRTTDKNGKYVWARIDNWYTSYCNTWEITDNTVICNDCVNTKKLALELQQLSSEDLNKLKKELNKNEKIS